jgi:antitoxin component YwqK of YwqJK toxin-antitoxin module
VQYDKNGAKQNSVAYRAGEEIAGSRCGRFMVTKRSSSVPDYVWIITTYKDGVPHGEQRSLRAVDRGPEDGWPTPSGQLSEVEPFVNGFLHGIRIVYWCANGQIHATEEWVNGTRHGLMKEYTFEGRLKKVVPAVCGKIHGRVLEYYKNGQLKLKTSMQLDMKHGEEVEFYESGKPRRRTMWRLNKKHGTETTYSEAGEIRETKAWNMGIPTEEIGVSDGGRPAAE